MGWSSWSKDSQERWKTVATIFSLVAVPIVLAIGGWKIQQEVSQESVKQQYVQLALQILREPPPKEIKEADQLRKWAVSIVDRNAPVKLTPEGLEVLYAKGLRAIPVSVETQVVPIPKRCREEYIITDDMQRFEKCMERERLQDEAAKRLKERYSGGSIEEKQF